MVDVCELTKFTASGKVLRLGRLWQTAIVGKWNPLFYAAPFVEFMLNVILRTIKAKGELKGREKSREKSRGKSREKILSLLRSNPTLTQSSLARHLGLSVKAIEKNIRILKDAQRLRRIGPDKGGHWEVAYII